MHRKRARSTVLAGLTAGAVALATACAPGSDTADRSSEPSADSEVSTDIAALGEITLTIWDQEVRGGQSDQFTTLIEDFEATYPNVTIERNAQAFDDLTTTLSLALSDPNPPDVVQANNGRSDMGTFVAAGQLTDLAPYAEAYGWTDRFPQTVLKNSTYSADGTVFGEGNLYGLPQMGEIVGVFYNTGKLEALGLEIPQTWAEFTEALQSAKDAGETPLMLGNLEGWPAGHVFGPVQGAYVPADEVTALGLGNPGASWTSAENLAAATELERWIAAGFFNDGVNGTDDQQAAEQFAEGGSVFMIAGSWNGAALDAAMGEDVGFFAPPAQQAGEPLATTGGTSLPFAIPTGSANKDAAAAFIDFITSEEAMQVLADTGNLPVLDAGTLVSGGGVSADIAAAFDEVSSGGTLLPYLDWSTPTFGDEALTPRLQDLFAGRIDAAALLDAFQADYAAFTD